MFWFLYQIEDIMDIELILMQMVIEFLCCDFIVMILVQYLKKFKLLELEFVDLMVFFLLELKEEIDLVWCLGIY